MLRHNLALGTEPLIGAKGTVEIGSQRRQEEDRARRQDQLERD